MVLTGGWLDFVLIFLALWFALLCLMGWRLARTTAPSHEHPLRRRLTIASIAFSAVAVASLLGLHLSWISPAVSQHLGVATIKILALLLFWPTLAGLGLSIAGSGRMRFLALGTCLITGYWWFTLLMVSAISMGAPLVRHPTKFLIPEGYVGWIEVKYGEPNAPGLQVNKGTFICKIPEGGLLTTSSPVEDGWAKDEYFYYAKDGSLHVLRDTGWGAGGMIWGSSNEWQQSQSESKPKQIAAYVYIGTEEQYHRAVSINESRPFDESKIDKVVH